MNRKFIRVFIQDDGKLLNIKNAKCVIASVLTDGSIETVSWSKDSISDSEMENVIRTQEIMTNKLRECYQNATKIEDRKLVLETQKKKGQVQWKKD